MGKLVIENDVLITGIEKLIKEGKQVSFTPKGSSMLPFIQGSKDTVQLTAPVNIQTGDIVLARIAPALYVLHRVIDIAENTILLMGDGNITGTEKCRPEDIIAIVVSIDKGTRIIDCHSKSHLRKAAIWKTLKPIRRYILAIYRRLT
jgi:hypothetical protein